MAKPGQLRKADQSGRPVYVTVHGQDMSVAISWVNKNRIRHGAKCDILVSFPQLAIVQLYSREILAGD